jgi:hypothetical protein
MQFHLAPLAVLATLLAFGAAQTDRFCIGGKIQCTYGSNDGLTCIKDCGGSSCSCDDTRTGLPLVKSACGGGNGVAC